MFLEVLILNNQEIKVQIHHKYTQYMQQGMGQWVNIKGTENAFYLTEVWDGLHMTTALLTSVSLYLHLFLGTGSTPQRSELHMWFSKTD